MKRFNSIIAIIGLAIVATAVAFVSCKKEKQEEKTNDALSVSQLSEMDKAMIAFGERLKSPESANEYMPLEEAINTLSNYENFLLCDASYNAPDMIQETFEVELPVSNGMVRLGDLYQLLGNNKNKILNRYTTLNGAEKKIFCITSKIMEEYASEHTVLVQTMVTMYNGPIRDDIYTVLFDSTDYWNDFGGLGQCGDYQGLCIGQDAVSRLQYKLREWMPLVYCDGRVYLTDHLQVTVLSIAYPDATSPNGYYAMPYSPDFNTPMCVSPEEMRWYYESIVSIYEDVEDADTEGRYVRNLTLNETSGGGNVRLCALNLELYKVNCSGAIIKDGE